MKLSFYDVGELAIKFLTTEFEKTKEERFICENYIWMFPEQEQYEYLLISKWKEEQEQSRYKYTFHELQLKIAPGKSFVTILSELDSSNLLLAMNKDGDVAPILFIPINLYNNHKRYPSVDKYEALLNNDYKIFEKDNLNIAFEQIDQTKYQNIVLFFIHSLSGKIVYHECSISADEVLAVIQEFFSTLKTRLNLPSYEEDFYWFNKFVSVFSENNRTSFLMTFQESYNENSLIHVPLKGYVNDFLEETSQTSIPMYLRDNILITQEHPYASYDIWYNGHSSMSRERANLARTILENSFKNYDKYARFLKAVYGTPDVIPVEFENFQVISVPTILY